MQDNNFNEENVTEVSSEEANVEAVQEVEENATEVTSEATTEVAEVTEALVEEKAPYDGPSVTVSTRYDYTTLKYYNIMTMVYKKHYPILYLALAAICIGYDVYMFIAGILPTINNGTFNAKQLLMPGIFVIFAAYSIYLFFNFEKSIDRSLTMHFNQATELTSVQTKVTLEGITVTSSKNPENPYFYDWIYITQIIEINQFYYFFSGRQPIIVSKDVNNILEGDAETLQEIIAEQITKKPYKRIDKEILKTPVTYVHQCDMTNGVEADASVNDVEEVQNEEEVVDVTEVTSEDASEVQGNNESEDK